jgi:hypothetical protein
VCAILIAVGGGRRIVGKVDGSFNDTSITE